MTASSIDSPRKKEPFVSSYDPAIFYTPLYNKTPTKTGMPKHHLVDYTIKLTVTLKDIGLEGLDSPYVKKSPRKSRRQRKQASRDEIPRVNTLKEEDIPVPEGDFPVPEDNIPFEEQNKRDNQEEKK